jgi:hypothetical protein
MKDATPSVVPTQMIAESGRPSVRAILGSIAPMALPGTRTWGSRSRGTSSASSHAGQARATGS